MRLIVHNSNTNTILQYHYGMFRTLLYAVLGLIIFAFVAVAVGYPIYDTNDRTPFYTLAIVIMILGVCASVWFARWVTKTGSGRLLSVSNRPKADWGVAGAVGGGFIAFQMLEYFNPTHAMPIPSILFILISIIVGARLLLYIARRFDLPNLMKISYDKPTELL